MGVWECMYVYYIVLSCYTHCTLLVPPYQPLSTGSGCILGARASRAWPEIGIGRTAIVVVRMPYIWSCARVLLYRWDFGLGNRTRDMHPIFWSPRALSFWTYSFKWVANHQDSNPGRLISSLTLYQLCHHAPLGVWECCEGLWMSMGVYECYGCLWVFIDVSRYFTVLSFHIHSPP